VTKNNAANFQQCINILDSVDGYLDERENEKLLNTNPLDKEQYHAELYKGLPELA